jgi:hypothetical protein
LDRDCCLVREREQIVVLQDAPLCLAVLGCLFHKSQII